MEEHTPERDRYFGLTPTQLNLAFVGVVAAVALGVGAYFGGAGAVGDFFGSDDGSSSATTGAIGTATPTPGATGDETPAPAPSPTGEAVGTPAPPPEVGVDAAAAQAAADAAVLTLDDLPEGWAVAPPDSDDSSFLDDAEANYSEECAWLAEDSEEEYPGEITNVDSEEFEGPDGQTASSNASVFQSAAEAQTALDETDDVFATCGDEFVAHLEAAAKLAVADSESEVGPIDVSFDFQKFDFAPLGEATIAFRFSGVMSSEAITINFTVDFVIMRQGSMVASVTYASYFVTDLFEEQDIAEIAAGKLAAASATLGG